MKSGPVYEALKNNKWREAVRLLTPLAKANPDVAYLIGLIYWDFTDTFKGGEKSLEWFSLAAKSGHLFAKVALARQYETGAGVRKKLSLARKLYEECAAAGSCEAASSLSEMCFLGEGGPIEDKRFIDLLIQVANDPKGGCRLETLNLCDFDSLEDYHLAAERDVVAVAQAYLGILAMDGVSVFPKSYANAVHWLQKAFDNGDSESGEDLAKLYLGRCEWSKARVVLEKLTENNNPEACYSLAELLRSLFDVTPEEVIRAYRKARNAGHPKARADLQAYEKKLSDDAWEAAISRYKYLDPLGNFSFIDLAPEKAENQYLEVVPIDIESSDPWSLRIAARGYMRSFHNGYEKAAEGIEKILKLVGPDGFRKFMAIEA